LTSCGELELSLEFPDCWDGENIDSADHHSHTSYEDPTTEDCPASHPIRIPKVWVFTRIQDYQGGPHLFSDGTGVFHADYFAGWDSNELQYIVDNCENPNYAPMPDGFCDKGGGGDDKFLTYIDRDKADGVKKESFDEDIAAKLKANGAFWPMLDTSAITTEAIDGVTELPGGIIVEGLGGHGLETSTPGPTTTSAGDDDGSPSSSATPSSSDATTSVSIASVTDGDTGRRQRALFTFALLTFPIALTWFCQAS